MWLEGKVLHATFWVVVGLGGLQQVTHSCSSGEAQTVSRAAAEGRGSLLEIETVLPAGAPGNRKSGPQSSWAEGLPKLQLATTKPNGP